MSVDAAPEVMALLTPDAVRERCNRVLDWVLEERSDHFSIELTRLPRVAAYVADVTRDSYPDLAVPYHSRWRHFSAGGIDRWAALVSRLASDPIEQAKAAVDLATVSVLLDAGTGKSWRYREPASGLLLERSEGLAVASFDLFAAGRFSVTAGEPLRVDAAALEHMHPDVLREGLQASEANPLVGLPQRAMLLQGLGRALRADVFGPAARPSGLIDHIMQAHQGRISAGAILKILLRSLSSIWPSGLTIGGVAVGDAGHHRAVRANDRTAGVVPFHKLSQWLVYSLIEPLQAAGIVVDGLDELTALAEYRNGGLLIDLGAITPRHPGALGHAHEIRSELVVEWRALTVALIDRLLPLVRAELKVGPDFSLPQLLQGGSWTAGRKIARTLRPESGEPPLSVVADGTVF